MNTPIYGFVKKYAESSPVRLHMPGHKGVPVLGCEPWDITEVNGADALYEASGIIAESEANASRLFGSARTLYSTEGSSQCLRAMVWMALSLRPEGTSPVLAASRNMHRSFLYAAALADARVSWLYPEHRDALCSCEISPALLEKFLSEADCVPAAVFITSPDYLGREADIAGLAEICRRYGTLLMVDNAHGAYRHFLPKPADPLTLGAAVCCASAHKTLPVLTGGAYLHIGKNAPDSYRENARQAMSLFGSSSPSYLILASLDRANLLLAEDYPARLEKTAETADAVRRRLNEYGWETVGSDPLRIVLRCRGTETAERLRRNLVEPECADRDFLVLMVSPDNRPEDLLRLPEILGRNKEKTETLPELLLAPAETVCSIRDAVFAPQKTIPVSASAGRVCGAPAVTCPPAVPVVMPGEKISPEAVRVLERFGVGEICVL